MTTSTRTSNPAIWALAVGVCGGGCSVDTRDDPQPTQTMTSVASSATEPTTVTDADTSGAGGSTAGGVDGTAGEKLDLGVMAGGCSAIDLLFVIDNSQSMHTYQDALAEQFPAFVSAMFDAIPPGIDVHVAVTTTDFDNQCSAAEATANCQTSSSLADVQSHYQPPTSGDDGGNGTQGRLFEWAGKRWFEASSSDDPAALSQWFSGAATAAGEAGCSFEMPVAAAGFATHPANDDTNAGFLRDEDALLVIFFLTDEPDKSPESKDVYAGMIRDAKQGCGGDACVFVAGLVPGCIAGVNQKLWQFMGLFGAEPSWSDITDVAHYDDLVGSVLADAVAQACANIPVG
ncbi:MAG: hypothetical protein IPK74_22090 [Deltaproteobacteria bacterium]|nr:hypothetical protein [Deltaproteobacteria bacterium]